MDRTKIQWTNFSWNPWHGCHKISEGFSGFSYMRAKETLKVDHEITPKKLIIAVLLIILYIIFGG